MLERFLTLTKLRWKIGNLRRDRKKRTKIHDTYREVYEYDKKRGINP